VTLTAPLFCGLALVADLTVEILLGPGWAATGPLLMLLCPGGFLLCVTDVIGAILLGLGQARDQFHLTVLNGCLLIAGAALGAPAGAAGVAAGFSIGAALATPAYLFVLGKQLATPVRVIMRDSVSPLAASLVMAVVVFGVLKQLPPWNPLLQLAILALCGAITFTVVLSVLSGDRLRQDLRWLLRPRREARSESPS
jgi:O-antigen/teichoic acid export membrane protein